MNRKIKIVIAIIDIVLAGIFLYLAIFRPFTITVSYDIQQLIAISVASGLGIFLLYCERLRKNNPETVKSLELLLYLIPPTVASFPLLAKVNYYLIPVACFAVIVVWFVVRHPNLVMSNTGEKKKIGETIAINQLLLGMMIIFIVAIVWFVMVLCTNQCQNS